MLSAIGRRQSGKTAHLSDGFRLPCDLVLFENLPLYYSGGHQRTFFCGDSGFPTCGFSDTLETQLAKPLDESAADDLLCPNRWSF